MCIICLILLLPLHQIEIFKMRFFNFSLLIFLLSVGFAEEQKTLTSRDYKKLFSQRFKSINRLVISDDEGKAIFILSHSMNKIT